MGKGGLNSPPFPILIRLWFHMSANFVSLSELVHRQTHKDQAAFKIRELVWENNVRSLR